MRRRPGRILRRPVARRLIRNEVGHIMPRPLALVGVPPHQGLALAPRLAVRVGGRAVVQDAPVGRPGPAPLGRDPVLLAAGLAARRLVLPVGVHAAVDPAAAGGGAVVLELRVGGQRLAVGVPAVDLGEHRLGGRLGQRPLHRVIPGEVQHRPVHLVSGASWEHPQAPRARQLGADQPPQVVGEPQLAARVARGLHRGMMPLQHPLGVGEAAALLGVRGGGHEEHLGADVLRAQLAAVDLRAVLPERRRLDQREVPHHQPLALGQAEPLQLAVGRARPRGSRRAAGSPRSRRRAAPSRSRRWSGCRSAAAGSRSSSRSPRSRRRPSRP